MNDSTFFCIMNNHEHYYLGFYKSDSNGYFVPAVSPNLSDGLKLTFEQEAHKIIKALGDKWKIKRVTI